MSRLILLLISPTTPQTARPAVNSGHTPPNRRFSSSCAGPRAAQLPSLSHHELNCPRLIYIEPLAGSAFREQLEQDRLSTIKVLPDMAISSEPPPTLSPVEAAVRDLQSIALPFILESIFWGMFILVYIFAALSLYGKKGLNHKVMLGITTTMFTAATTHWSLELWSFLQVLSDPNSHGLRSDYVPRSTALSLCLGTNFFFSDAIVLWRACILWKGNRFVYTVSALLLALTFTFECIDIALARNTISHTQVTFPIPIVLYNAYGTVCVVSSLGANIWATILVGLKAWKYRRSISRDLKDSSSSSIAQKLMSILLECGVLYCLIWVLFIVAFVTDAGALVLGGREDVADQSSDHIVAQLTGIYPTIIIVLVRYRRTYNDQTFNPSTLSNLQFNAEPPARSNYITPTSQPTRRSGSHGATFELSAIELYHAQSDISSNSAPNFKVPEVNSSSFPVYDYPA